METSTVAHSFQILRSRSAPIESGEQPYMICHRPGSYRPGDVVEFVVVNGSPDGLVHTGHTFRKIITHVTELFRHFPGIGQAVVLGLKDGESR